MSTNKHFWEVRASRPSEDIKTPEMLWQLCCEYFVWNEENPLQESRPFAYEGQVTIKPVPKMRAMTIAGLCMFLGMSIDLWKHWRAHRDGFQEVMQMAEEVIRRQKFEGAAASMLSTNFIARDLGMADRNELSGPDGGPIKTEVTSARDILAGKLAGMSVEGSAPGDPDQPE